MVPGTLIPNGMSWNDFHQGKIQAGKEWIQMGKIYPINTYVENGEVEPGRLAGETERHFQEKAYLYAVLDEGVALGTYEKGIFQVRLSDTDEICELPWTHVRELAVFHENKELRFRCVRGVFRKRLRLDRAGGGNSGENGGGDGGWRMDETQKLWGETARAEKGWSLLTSARGSRIWVPISFAQDQLQEGIGIQVRRYLTFPDASDCRGLMRVEDERFLGFCSWPGRGAGENEVYESI